MTSILQDIAYALRMIRKTPGITAIAIVSLALGVAANTSIFSVLNSWLLRPLPYPDVDRLVLVWEVNRNDTDAFDGATPADFFDWREQSTSFDALIAANFTLANMTGLDRPEQLTVAEVTPNFFDVLGARPLLGRAFQSDEGGSEDTPVAIIGERLWRNRFGADEKVIGQTVTLDGVTHSVVGVIPETFDFLLGTVSMWTASDFEARRDDRLNRALNVTGRLRPGVPFAQAQSEMTALAARIEDLHPATHADWTVNRQTVRESFPGESDRGLITILTSVVFMVLLVACINIASLMLAKTDARHREIAVRIALGAGKRRLVRQLLTESVVLALIAGTLGTILSVWGVGLLAQAVPEEIPAIFTPRFDGTVLAFSLAASVFAGLTFGLTPALQAVGGQLRSALVDGTRGGTATKKKKRLRAAFVMAEFAMALTILIGAGVLTDVFARRLRIDPGFESTNLLTMELTLPEHKYGDDGKIVAFIDRLRDDLGRVPGVSDYALMNVLPRTRRLPSTPFTIDGQLIEEDEEPTTSWLSVSPDYVRAMQISLQSGRAFSEGDRADAPLVIMVNRAMAERFFEGGDPIGRRITVNAASREIVGVVNNIAQRRLTGLEPVRPAVYFPMAQRPVRRMNVALRTATEPLQIAATAHDVVWNIDPDQPVTAVQTMNEHMAAQIAGPTMMAQILFFVGGLALALAAIGIYGVMSYTVSQQTTEIGLRMALGANPLQVLGAVTRQGIRLAGFGLLIGTPMAAFTVRFIGSTLDTDTGIRAAEGITAHPIVVVSAVLVSVGLIASYLPARRATKIDPVRALQYE
jgi:putative ABC transport system permease protein